VPQEFGGAADEQVLVADTPLQIAGREDKTEPQITVTGVLLNAAKGAVADVQDYAMLCGRTLASIFTPPYYLQDILKQMDNMGPVLCRSSCYRGSLSAR